MFGCSLNMRVLLFSDSIPDASFDSKWYTIAVVKNKEMVSFYVNDLKILD